jgi:hypothetical protein
MRRLTGKLMKVFLVHILFQSLWIKLKGCLSVQYLKLGLLSRRAINYSISYRWEEEKLFYAFNNVLDIRLRYSYYCIELK